MWTTWIAVLLLSSGLAVCSGAVTAAVDGQATTHRPHRTLDRQADELAWRNWLKSPESGNQNAPPRRITTKSLFIPPLVCPRGQRLDRNACVQVLTVNRDEHESLLLEQLNRLFNDSAAIPSDGFQYDYEEDELGPLQLTIPIGFEIQPQPSSLHGHGPLIPAQEMSPNVIEKKDENKINTINNGESIEAELELLKLPHNHHQPNDTNSDGIGILNHNVFNNFLPQFDKPKREDHVSNETEISTDQPIIAADEGQKELIYGQINVDPVMYDTEYKNQESNTPQTTTTEDLPETTTEILLHENITIEPTENHNLTIETNLNSTILVLHNGTEKEKQAGIDHTELKKDGEKLSPENDYSDIGEAIKLISRYAEVTTDDNFSKNKNKAVNIDDSVLGTRTRMQHRRNKPKDAIQEETKDTSAHAPQTNMNDNVPNSFYPKNVYYRYPWQSDYSPTPPANYPFRHIQDYWPGKNQVGGVYNNAHENPRRHHHSFPHNYFRLHGYPYVDYTAQYPPLEAYAGQIPGYPPRISVRHPNSLRPRSDNQDLYSLLGLRHWFSGEGTSKR